MKVFTAGQYFSVTKGGAPMTSNDMFIVMERKKLLAKAKTLEKRKEAIIAYSKVEDRAHAIISSGQCPDEWISKDSTYRF
jgi:hypothetical protein